MYENGAPSAPAEVRLWVGESVWLWCHDWSACRYMRERVRTRKGQTGLARQWVKRPVTYESEGETKGGMDRVRVNDVCVSHGVLATGGFTALRHLDPAAFHLHNEQMFQCEQGHHWWRLFESIPLCPLLASFQSQTTKISLKKSLCISALQKVFHVSIISSLRSVKKKILQDVCTSMPPPHKWKTDTIMLKLHI